jgi:hypothetical protein
VHLGFFTQPYDGSEEGTKDAIEFGVTYTTWMYASILANMLIGVRGGLDGITGVPRQADVAAGIVVLHMSTLLRLTDDSLHLDRHTYLATQYDQLVACAN